MPIELSVLLQNVLITKLSTKMDHVRHAQNSSEELIMHPLQDSQDKLNVLNALATLNSEENTASQVEHVLPAETTFCQLLKEEAAEDQIAQKQAQLSRKMDHVVFAQLTTTSKMMNA
jgi:hypothetical protein